MQALIQPDGNITIETADAKIAYGPPREKLSGLA